MKKLPPKASAASDAELTLYSSIRSLVLSARSTVARGVDLIQVRTNFEIGRHIVEYEQQGEARTAYGKELLALLAERLTAEFGKGFGRSNIAYARSFYLAYQARRPIVQTASGQLPSGALQPENATLQIFQTASGKSERPFSLSWSHYVFLLGIKKTDERDFYEIEAASQDWTVRELKRQFDSGLYERLALSRDKDGIRLLAQQGQIVSRPQDLLKEPLVLEFLGPSELARVSTSMLGVLKKVDATFRMRKSQKYTAVNKDGFEVDIIRREQAGDDPHPIRLSDEDDDFWVAQARRANVLLDSPGFSAVIVASNGSMARMNTDHPATFVAFKRWMSTQTEREAMKRRRDALQADTVQELLEKYLPQL